MFNLFFAFVPDYTWIVILVFAAIGLIFGVITRSGLKNIFLTIFLFTIFGVFIEGLLFALPVWISLLMIVICGIWVVSTILEFILGKEGYGNLTGDIAYQILKFIFLAPFRLIRWLFTRH